MHDFLITDKRLADNLSNQINPRNNDERLLIAEHEDGLDLSLYISGDIIKYLKHGHPEDLILQGRFSEFCLMLEGVSHFVYLIWNANHQKKITLLEMELQAEIDKFVLLQSLYDKGHIQNWLFEKHEFDDVLNDEERERYERANHYAGKYCMGLQQQYQLNDLNNALLNELRRFYRLGQEEKMRYIDRLN